MREAEQRARGEFMVALLAEPVDEARVIRRAQVLGVDLASIRSVVLHDGAVESATARFAQQVAGEGGWSGEHFGTQVVMSADSPPALADRCADLAPRHTTVVLADCAGGVPEVASAYHDASSGLRLATALGRVGEWVRTTELGIYRRLLSTATASEVTAFVDSRIGALVTHDVDHGSELVTTVRTYLEQGRHHGRTATALTIHPNTLYGRLARVRDLLGPQWTGSDRIFEIDLALRLAALGPADQVNRRDRR